MAITTYSELQTAVGNWLNRTDLSSRIPEFIALAESRLNRRLRLRVMEDDETLTGVVGSRIIAVPSGYVAPISFFIVRTTGREPLTFVRSRMETYTAQSEPRYWTIDNTNIAFERPCDSAYSFLFKMYLGFALTNSVTTNWLLTNHPDAYLYASVAEGFKYLRNDNATSEFEALTDRAIKEIQDKENQSRDSALRTDVPRQFRTFNVISGY